MVGAGVAGAALAYRQGQVRQAGVAAAGQEGPAATLLHLAAARQPPVNALRRAQQHAYAGAAALHALPPPPCAACAQDGRRVLLLERDLSQPDRIVGELLQPGGYLMLKKLGLEEATQQIDSVKVRPANTAAGGSSSNRWQR